MYFVALKLLELAKSKFIQFKTIKSVKTEKIICAKENTRKIRKNYNLIQILT